MSCNTRLRRGLRAKSNTRTLPLMQKLADAEVQESRCPPTVCELTIGSIPAKTTRVGARSSEKKSEAANDLHPRLQPSNHTRDERKGSPTWIALLSDLWPCQDPLSTSRTCQTSSTRASASTAAAISCGGLKAPSPQHGPLLPPSYASPC